MRLNSKLAVQATYDGGKDAGEGLAIFFTQNGDSVCRYRFLIKAMIGEGVYDVGEIYSSPPTATPIPGRLTRMIGGAVCPGATSWAVYVSAVPDPELGIPAETAEIVLSSSRCCTSPLGVSRVGERYAYAAGTDGIFTVLAGMRVTGVAALGLTGGGSVTIGGGQTVIVPEGAGANLSPEVMIHPNTVITFTNVDWILEYKESA